MLEKNNGYRLSGRYTRQDGVLYLGYSASYVEFSFHGKKAEAEFITDRLDWDENMRAWVAVFVDDMTEPVKRFPLLREKETVTLVEKAETEDTTVRIMKYSEAAFGAVGIAAIDVDGTILPAPAPKKKKLEVIGDSITCGYGIEGVIDVDSFKTSQENPWHAYGCLLAKKFDAEVSLVSWSGNGIISHYIDASVEEPRVDDGLMPDLYPYADFSADVRRGKAGEEFIPWDFASYQPQLIVINLGTNDCSYTRRLPERNQKFMDAYTAFLVQVRKNNPDANILCTLGVMQTELNDCVPVAVQNRNNAGDTKVYFVEAPLQNAEEDGLGADSHPTERTQQKLADFLENYIREHDLF